MSDDIPPVLNEASYADTRKKILDLMNRQRNMALSQGFLIGFLFGITAMYWIKHSIRSV